MFPRILLAIGLAAALTNIGSHAIRSIATITEARQAAIHSAIDGDPQPMTCIIEE